LISQVVVCLLFFARIKLRDRLLGSFPFFVRLQPDCVRKIVNLGLAITTVFGLLLTLLFVFYGGEVFTLFVPGQIAFDAGQLFLRIEGYTMLFMMVEITIQGVFFGTGRTLPPALISSVFNLLRIPLAIILAKNGMGLAGIWWAISLTSLLKGLTAFSWFQAIKKRIL
jgi:Na+-driven multidrug efflux pump